MSETLLIKSDDYFPEELQYTPIPYISLIGLNAQNNAIHAMIWNSFTVNRASDRPPLYFKLLFEKYSFIPSKPKKSSYEWHIPKGILKTSWLQKHLFEVPSVCVLFFELNWDDLNWNQKRTECVAKVEYLRRSLNARNTRITLVLIQSSTPLPSDDSLVTERAALLCSSCDLNAKSLFVLQVSDVSQLMGYILRMETALYELAKAYYLYESKLVKAHRDQLNKTTHQLLYVRHQFKIAFFNELRQDPTTALKHYKNSYANLMEVRVTTTNLYEIKTIGGFVNYKICKLCFQVNTPLDAISQFRKHIDIFKNKSEPKEVEFEHSLWLSKQFALFAELFDVAIMSGLIPSQMQNPGHYYYEAALQTMQRKKLCLSLCTQTNFDDLSPENLELFNSVLHPTQQMEFFGQRSWRPGCQTLEPIDSEKEKIGIKALQYKELSSINHSELIIVLLSNAINQFKKYKCPRIKRYLMVLVAEQYFYNKDYTNALTFLNNVLPQYRQEGWQSLIHTILIKALQSAYLSADAINFVKLGLESISSNRFTTEHKISIQESIHNIMRKQLPLLLSDIDPNDSEIALKLWSNVLQSSEPIILTIKMDSFMNLIECKPKFTSNCFYCNQTIRMDLFLQSNAPNPIRFTKMNVLFSNQFYNQFCERIDSSEEESENNLLLMPSKLHKFSFEMIPLSEDIDRKLTIIGLNLTLGTDSMSAIMQCSFIEETKFADFPKHSSNITDIKHITTLLTTKIVKPIPKMELKITHNPPALMNEFYSIGFSIINKEPFDVSNVRINLNVFDSNGDQMESNTKTYIWFENQFIKLIENHCLKDIKVNEELNEKIVFKFENIENHSIVFTVTYDSVSEMGTEPKLINLSVTEKMTTDVIIPFVNTCELLNVSSGKVSQVRVSEPFFLKVLTKQSTEIGIKIIESKPVFHESITCLTQITNDSKDNDFDQMFKIIGSEEHSNPLCLGICLIKWKRKTDSENMSAMVSETSVPLPMISIMSSPLFVELEFPEVCVARNPVILRYNIYNRTDTDLPLELSMGTSDNFMYSGNKLIQMVLSAKQKREQNYILYPLVCGSILLPKFRIVMNPETNNAKAIDFMDQIIPNQILVFPQNKIPIDL